MHIHELIAFQGQLLSVKNPHIMNYCPRGGPGFSTGLQASKLLQSLHLALKKTLPTEPAFGQMWGGAENEASAVRNPLAPRLPRAGAHQQHSRETEAGVLPQSNPAYTVGGSQ